MLTRREFGGGVLVTTALMATPLRASPSSSQWTKLFTVPFKGKQDDIFFSDPDHGWYGNGEGKLYRTVNGGATWEKVWDKPGTFIRALGFSDNQTGYLGNVGTNYYPNVTDTQPLYRTTDGGASWTPVTAEGIEKVAGICGIDILPQSRIFQGEVRNVPIITAAGRVGGPAALLRSIDGGESWTVQDLSAHAGMILDVKFLGAKTGFVCAATNANLEEAEALILRTGDGGKTWKPVYRSGRKFENCWKMNFPSKKVGYATVQSYDKDAANVRRVVVKTKDSGRTWKELLLTEKHGLQQFGIGFADEKRGWVGCNTNGFETRDGGKSWTPIEFGRAVNKVRVVRGGGLTRAFAIGVDVYRLDL